MSSFFIFINPTYSFPKELQYMNKSGFQRAADGISEYESQNRFPVRRLCWEGHCYPSFPEGKLEAAGNK